MYFDSPLQQSYVYGDKVGIRAKVKGNVNNLRFRIIDPNDNEKVVIPAGLVTRDSTGTDWLAQWNTLSPLLDNQGYRIQALADSIYPDPNGNPVTFNFEETTLGTQLPIILNNQYCPWECTPYSQCAPDGSQTRACSKAADANCYNLDAQPATTQKCTYVASTNAPTSTLPAPTISTPAENAELSDPLPTISGTSAPGLSIIVYLKSDPIAKVVADSGGRYSFKVEKPLAPGDYGLQVEQLKADGTKASASQPRFFKVLRPTGTIASPKSGDLLRGAVTLKADIKGGVKTLDFLFSGTPEKTIGSGRFNPTSNLWELKADTLNFQNGEYYLFARVQDLSGTVYFTTTPAVKVKIDNPVEVAPSTGTTAVVAPEPIVDSDGDGLSDADETDLYHTNPNSPDTDGDGYTDADEIRGGFNPNGTGTLSDVASGKTLTAIEEAIAATVVEQPTTHGTLAPEKLKVEKVQNVAPTPSENNLVFEGKGPPNSIVTIYIYSSPIVVTTRTDSEGNFTYTLDKDLDEGKHEVYVAIADEGGKIVEKSEPTVFFVRQAKAVSEEEFFRADVNVQSDAERLTNRYLLVSGLIVILVLLIYLASRAIHYGQPKGAALRY